MSIYSIFSKAEKSIGKTSAAWVLVSVTLFLFTGLVLYVLFGERHDGYEYASFVFPCMAAIVAGMSVYLTNWVGLLYTASSGLLLLGAFFFMQNHPQNAFLVAGSLLSVLIFMLITLIRIFTKGKGLLSFGYDIHEWIIIVFLVLVCVYAACFYYLNRNCIQDGKSCNEVRFLLSHSQGK